MLTLGVTMTAEVTALRSLRAEAVSAALPGVLPRVPLVVERGKLVLRLEGELAALESERLYNRVRRLGKLIGREPAVKTR
jgi:exopolyphosphatase/guanosine-5'-triphosphate,3'-diphosphate pyrophosphatase